MSDCKIHILHEVSLIVPDRDIIDALKLSIETGKRIERFFKASPFDGGKEIRIPLNYRNIGSK